MFDRLAWVCRYAKGALPYREAKALDGWELREFGEALHRLVQRENQQTPDEGPDQADVIELDREEE